MGQQVVHVEVVGQDPARLREFYAELFGWEYDLGDTVSPAVSAPGEYGFVTGVGADPVHGGVGGGPGLAACAVFYVGVPDVDAALRRVEELGGAVVVGPQGSAEAGLVVGRFTDPEGNLVGVAGAS